jgi:hypothetical protein
MKQGGKRGHLTLEELVNLARETGPDAQQSPAKGHLRDCKKCAGLANTWRRVADVARRPVVPEPPEGAVRTVKALYSAHKPQKTKQMRPFVGELLFDSSLMPLQAGVRSSVTSPRQLLFGSGEYRVDLRIEPQVDADMVSFLGQILHETDQARNLGSIAVTLVHGRKTLAASQTNHLGEFHLQCDLKPALELRVMLPDSQISIPLVDPLRDRPQGNSDTIANAGLNYLRTRGVR